MLKNFKVLLEKARKNPRVAIAAAEDPPLIEAVIEVRKQGIVRFVLTGDQLKIEKLLRVH